MTGRFWTRWQDGFPIRPSGTVFLFAIRHGFTDLTMKRDNMPEDEAVTTALAVMDAHIAALNSREQSAIAATPHFPHIRLSGSALKIWETEDSYFADFLARAGGDWHHSAFANIRLLRASASKVHLDAEIRRFTVGDRLITSFRSLWVITDEGGRWAAKMRSTFAPE